ncbi:RICIN domain-containing protein [Amycolatopsis sp. NPDC051102]|uniref:RICIN domain-containing protein n=1 Tax=Amycolatopsis sp. NPDC051102 TaxID=3155163 RepID=UPI003435BCCF
MTKMKRLMVTVAAAAGLFGLVAVPQAGAAQAGAAQTDGKGGDVPVQTLAGGIKLRPAKVGAAHRSTAGAAGAQVAEADAYLIESAAFGRCWDADLNTINANGTIMALWDCNVYAANQAFYITRNPEGYLRFQNVQSGRYLEADLTTIGKNGTKVQLWDYSPGGKNQWWIDTVNPEGYLRLQNPASNRYLTGEGQVGGNGTRMQLWDFMAGAKSQWWS